MENNGTIKDFTQNLTVFKHNDLVQNSRYTLSMMEQKVILFWISKIKPSDTDFREAEFDMNDFCLMCGIEPISKNKANLRDTLLALQKKPFGIVTKTVPKKEITWFTWFSSITFTEKSPIVRMTFSPDLLPYLLNIQESFTAYWLENILPMKSAYSIRLYEILHSYVKIGGYTVDLDDFKELLDATSYDRWDNLKIRVIEPAINEINLYTDISVSYLTEKNGKNIEKINFTLTKNTYVQNLQSMIERNKKLCPVQMKYAKENKK